MMPSLRRAFLSACAISLTLTGCGGAPSGPVEVSEADRAYGAEQHPRLLAEFGGAYRGEESRYVAALGEKMAHAAGLQGQCVFTLVNSDVVNAFAVPGCYIYVTRGLFAIVTSEAELASVLGHELGHIVGAHSRRQERRSIWRTLGVIAVSLTGSEQLTRLAGQAAQYFTLRYSRTQEYESDALGIRYLQSAGYDPHAAADMLTELGLHDRFLTVSSGRDEASSIPEWASSHPLTQHRVERARDLAGDIEADPNRLPENEAAYLNEVDGLLYGDDPEQGFVLGRIFAHPVMRIGFEAPPGFSLTNSPQAILLSGPDGLRGEFGGGPMPEGRLDLYAQELARQIVGHGQGRASISQTLVNGLPTVLVELQLAGRQGTVPVSIAAYDGGDGQAYHFAILSPPARPSLDLIGQLFRSFHRLSPDELARLRPRVIRTVVVGASDTVASMAVRTVDAHPRELFLMLNGKHVDAVLEPGERVKIVSWAEP